ncbi:MAG: lipoprotein [bacterium]|nr:lipoprotein [bacterium]
MSLFRFMVFASLLFVVSACGQKGPLYLPVPPKTMTR